MKKTWLPQLIAIGMLLWALKTNNPYGYYILLRIICCSICAYLTLQFFKNKNENWTWILGVTTFIYNPILRVHLTKEIWIIVNILTIIMLIISIVSLSKTTITGTNNERT